MRTWLGFFLNYSVSGWDKEPNGWIPCTLNSYTLDSLDYVTVDRTDANSDCKVALEDGRVMVTDGRTVTADYFVMARVAELLSLRLGLMILCFGGNP